MNSSHRCRTAALFASLLLIWFSGGGLLFGAEVAAPSLEQRVAQLEQAAKTATAANSGDNAWMLVSSALVLMMTAPGLILFYGGLVRTKNVLSTMMHSLVLMALISALWMIFGYSMAFGEGNAFVGNPFQYFLLSGFSPDPDSHSLFGKLFSGGFKLFTSGVVRVGSEPDVDYAPTIPAQTFMLFQMMFAIIAPALISGAVAERIKFSAYIVFMLLWVTIVYLPLCHMVWGKGGLFNWALGGKIPVLDFAGGTVVHISSGVSALVCALVLGKRHGFPHAPMMPHNVVLSLIGTGLLWVGWFGFNAGSAVSAGGLATSAFAATHFSAAAAALSWAGMEWWLKGRASVLGAASGMVAGLATITPASGFVNVPAAFGIGLTAGIVCYLAVTKLKATFGYDDSLDVFGVHGVGSITGMLMLGLLANPNVNPAIATTFQVNGAVVSLAGGPGQFLNQLIAVLFTAALSGSATFVILKVVDRVIGLRVDQEDESLGLDLSQHGERAYNE